MLTILLTFLLWLILNSVAQSDLKAKPVAVTKAKLVRKRQKFTPEQIAKIDLLLLMP
jgi:hypothetical protein